MLECKKCSNRHTCYFAKDLEKALHNIGAFLSQDSRKNVETIVDNELNGKCPDYKEV